MDERDLAAAIGATFHRLGTSIPNELPIGLTSEFALDRKKIELWAGFLKKNALVSPSLDLVIGAAAAWLGPAMGEARRGKGQVVAPGIASVPLRTAWLLAMTDRRMGG